MGDESPKPANTSTGAVFLSYASQDVDAAKRICGALRAASIEVWFDQSELRGGDAWDQSIRKQIKNCTLFIPVVSRHTHERAEGYFRLEWKLAVDRSHLIMANKAFLVPVVIDDTPGDDENVPEKFREVQWTRLPDGVTQLEFVGRIKRLLSAGAATTARLPSGAASSSLPVPMRTGRSTQIRRALPVPVALLVLSALAYVLISKPWSSKPAAPPAPTSAVVEEKSLAVLPFVDMSEKRDQEYFSDGLSEELIDRLAHSPDLKVIARTSSFAFKGKSDDVRTIAARLGVANLLEGSVRKSDNMLRITAQLIRARDGTHIWSQSFDRNEANIFQLQEEIAATVATALQSVLSSRAKGTNPDIRPGAYNAFLRGKYFRERGAKGDRDRAVAAFQDAVRLEPNYALAWAELGGTFNGMGLSGQMKPPEAYTHARESLGRALDINPELAEAHFLLSALLWNYKFDFRQSRAELHRALELDPHVDTANFLVIDAIASGRTADAVHEARRLIERDPLTARNYSELASALYYDSQFQEAEAAQRKALELNPDGEGGYAFLASIALARNAPTTALELAGHESDEESKQSVLINILWALGRREESDSALRAFEPRYGDSHAVDIASSYVFRGDFDTAFRWLDRAYQNREPYLTLIGGNRDFRNLHSDPRFKALLAKLGLNQ